MSQIIVFTAPGEVVKPANADMLSLHVVTFGFLYTLVVSGYSVCVAASFVLVPTCKIFVPKVRDRDATARRADLIDLDCSAKWHLVSRYRTATFLSLTEVKMQRHFKTNIPELYSCTYTPLSLSFFGASSIRRADRLGWFVGKDRGNSFRFKFSLPRAGRSKISPCIRSNQHRNASKTNGNFKFWRACYLLGKHGTLYSYLFCFSLGCCNQRLLIAVF